MVFAAGFGTRMGQMTQDRPKPLISVQGRALIDYALELVHDAGLENIVVNAHYRAEQLQAHLLAQPNIRVVLELPDILETGGGLKNALPHLGAAPVFTLNSDMIWTGNNPLEALKEAWDPARMDALLMLIPLENAQENTGCGDFLMDHTGVLERRGGRPTAPHVYSGAQIIKTDLLRHFAQRSFSLNLVWDQMMKDGRVYGISHDGGWVDVGRPEGIATAEAELQRSGYV